MSTLIFSARLNSYRPIHRGGVELYRYADRLRTLLADRLGQGYGELLARPYISEDAKHFYEDAHWRSDQVTNPRPLPQLPATEQQAAAALLAQYLQTISRLADQLRADPDPKNRELGDFLNQAVQIPSLDCVMVEGNRIVLVLWGFTSDESQKKNFQIAKALEAYPPDPVVMPPVNTPSTTPPSTVQPAQTPAVQPADTIATATTATTGPVPPKRRPWWLWVLPGLLLLLLLGWLARQCATGPGQAFVPDDPTKIQPIDPGKTKADPDDQFRRTLVTNRLLLLLDKGQTMNGFADELAKKYKPEQVKITHFNENVNIAQVTFADTNYARWRQELRQLPGVITVVPEYLVPPQMIPGDPQFANPVTAYHFKAVQAYQAWDVTMGKPDVTVAIVDGGLDVTHPELTAHLVHSFDIVPDQASIRLLPGEVHGTHVSGLAIGAANNGQGASGIAPGCSYMPVQISDPKIKGISTINIIAGLAYAIKNGANVVNMSLGLSLPPDVADKVKALSPAEQKQIARTEGLDEETLWREVYAYARRSNVVVVKSAGNDGILADLDPMNRSDDIIVVGATDQQNRRTDFSNYGPAVTVSAPGSQVFSSVPGNQYTLMSGTSMAAPIVTGGVALLLSRNPNLTLAQIKQILVGTGQPVEAPDGLAVGPLIQLGVALAQAGSPPPAQDCQQTVDSLRREIERLKQQGSNRPVMRMPAKPLDCSFAGGNWRSSTDLLNQDSKPLELYFTFDGQCAGTLTFVESESQTRCEAPLQMQIKNNQLLIAQTVEAPCRSPKPGGTPTYRKHQFDCRPNADGIVECIETVSQTRFQLTKQ